MNKKQFPKPAEILKSLLPALFTGGIMLSFAAAPMLAAIPERLEWSPPVAVEHTESVSAPTAAEAQDTDAETTQASEELCPGYEDGSHIGVGTGFGGEIRLRVLVEQGRIAAIEILSAPGETEPFWTRAGAVIDRILSAQSWEVDAVSGATYSSEGIKAAVKNALTGEAAPRTEEAPRPASGNSQALTELPFDPPQNGYQDGVYSGSAQGFGGRITVRVTIAGGRLTDITVVSAAGETPSYFNRAKSVLSAILKAQNPEVDAVSGATYSSRGLINAVKDALRKAGSAAPAEEAAEAGSETPQQTEQTAPEAETPAVPNYGYPDGAYAGVGTGFGGQIKLEISIQNGLICSIQILEADNETPEFLAKAKGVIERILAAQSAEVDAVAGATLSSNGIKEAVANALAAANAAANPTQPAESEPAETEAEPTEPEESGPIDPDEPAPPTVERFTESYVGAATVTADEEEEFWDYEILLTVTVSVERTTTERDGQREIRTLRTVTELSVSADADATNLAFLNRAFQSIKPQLLQGCDEIDAVSGATCSSNGIREAWKQAVQDVVLGETIEITEITEELG